MFIDNEALREYFCFFTSSCYCEDLERYFRRCLFEVLNNVDAIVVLENLNCLTKLSYQALEIYRRDHMSEGDEIDRIYCELLVVLLRKHYTEEIEDMLDNGILTFLNEDGDITVITNEEIFRYAVNDSNVYLKVKLVLGQKPNKKKTIELFKNIIESLLITCVTDFQALTPIMCSDEKIQEIAEDVLEYYSTQNN